MRGQHKFYYWFILPSHWLFYHITSYSLGGLFQASKKWVRGRNNHHNVSYRFFKKFVYFKLGVIIYLNLFYILFTTKKTLQKYPLQLWNMSTRISTVLMYDKYIIVPLCVIQSCKVGSILSYCRSTKTQKFYTLRD